MVSKLWINLAVKSIPGSRDFFSNPVFPFHPGHEGRTYAAILLSGNTMVMPIPESRFAQCTSHLLSDTSNGCKILIPTHAKSSDEVDKIAADAAIARGFGKPSEIRDFIYGCGFCNPIGHHWNVFYYNRLIMT